MRWHSSRRVGLSPAQVQILVNNRQLMDGEFDAWASCRTGPEVLRLIDRRDKMSPDEWESYAQRSGLSDAQFDGAASLLANRDLWRKSPRWCASSRTGCPGRAPVCALTHRRSSAGWTTTPARFSKPGTLTASSAPLFGGGRYDNLVSQSAASPLPAVGFAMGDVVIGLLLKKLNLLPAVGTTSPAPILVTVFDESTLLDSLRLASELRQAGLNVACYPEATKLARQFRFADRSGIKIVLVVGPDEDRGGHGDSERPAEWDAAHFKARRGSQFHHEDVRKHRPVSSFITQRRI